MINGAPSNHPVLCSAAALIAVRKGMPHCRGLTSRCGAKLSPMPCRGNTLMDQFLHIFPPLTALAILGRLAVALGVVPYWPHTVPSDTGLRLTPLKSLYPVR